MRKELNLKAIKKHFGDRLKLDYEFYPGDYIDGQVCYMFIDNEQIGYFDNAGKMSPVGRHIELHPELSKKYFNKTTMLKRYFTHKDFINFVDNEMNNLEGMVIGYTNKIEILEDWLKRIEKESEYESK